MSKKASIKSTQTVWKL